MFDLTIFYVRAKIVIIGKILVTVLKACVNIWLRRKYVRMLKGSLVA